jgi:glycogen(starch) synthase
VRCLILSWEYPPLVEGGLGRHVGRLAPGLAGLGLDVDVLTRGAEAAQERRDGVAVHRVAEARRPDDVTRLVAWVERLNDQLLAAGTELGGAAPFDLVHGHDWLVAEAAERLAGRFGCPLAMTIHATEHGRHRGWVAGEPQAQIHAAEARAVHGADRLIVCSEYMRGHLADVFGVGERRISVIPNGVDAGAAVAGRAGVRDAVAVPSERLVLLAGRLVHEKGFQLALDALPHLVERLGAVRLVVAGAGIHGGALRAAAAAGGLADRVTFLGWVDAARLSDLYAVADACVVPSIYEPFGLVALEAMAAGCPCVVADTGGLREVVAHGETGLRFTAGDPGSLAAMVERILVDRPLRQRLVAAAREHVRGFGWAAVAARTAGVYRELCPARPAAVLGSGQ